MLLFNVWVEKKVTNKTTNTVVFYAKTFNCFKVKNSFQKPTSEFYFDLIDKATYDFALQFHQRTQNTNLAHNRICKPSLLQFKEIIERTINIWDEKISNKYFPTPPNWQSLYF